jgi:hypothetical protein
LLVDGQSYIPEVLGKQGLRFVSIHEAKKQRFVVTYARGMGEVEVLLPPDARSGVVQVAKGFDFLPVEIPFTVSGTTGAGELAAFGKGAQIGFLIATAVAALVLAKRRERYETRREL